MIPFNQLVQMANFGMLSMHQLTQVSIRHEAGCPTNFKGMGSCNCGPTLYVAGHPVTRFDRRERG